MLIRRVYSKSYHWERALTQVIILQLPRISPEGVTLYIYTLFGCPSGARTQDTTVNSRMLVPTELKGNIKSFLFSYIYIITYFFIKIKKDFQGSYLFGSDVYTISPLSQIMAGEAGVAPTSFAASDFGSFNSC